MKKSKYIFLLFSLLAIAGCKEDFLDRNPLDEISEPEFWKTTGDLELYANAFYQNLPGWAGVGNGFSPMPDNGTDLSLSSTEASTRLLGNVTIPTTSSTSVWNWSNVRKANYFLANVDKATGAEADINQYKGEGLFFRAYYYFSLLKSYGDLPIIDKYIENTDVDYLYKGRDPRNKVVDFMLSDLDQAISLLKTKSELTASNPRINKEAALLLKATVALYEGTWEKYHQGTAYGVEGSTGATYLQQAAESAKKLIDDNTLSLHNSYAKLFNQTSLSANSEVILWKEYNFTFGNSYGNDLQISWPNRSSYSRFAVRSYLCKDGLPYALSPLYQGDQLLSKIEVNRDPRLAATIMVPGDTVAIAVNGTITPFTVPKLTTNNAAVGGYESQKYRIPNIDPLTGTFTRSTAKIIMRYAEALLIYAEAKAELGTITQADLDISINKLRKRSGVGMPDLVMSSIVTDPNWPNYGYSLTPVLYEIRRERTVELMNEGFRFDDMMRWRAHALFLGQRPRGAYYEQILKSAASNLKVDSENYLDPYITFVGTAGYAFKPERDYLSPIPTDEITINPNLKPNNPGW
ncbi:putative outer membrane starch-binding protein [Dyadobacter jejuensis]|uniref:Putative outer membrane starch-binding protein n=1 Tax=Dyadobacter jejuensis TaxID=1082580 RepID=A0A316AIK7_9BACT|nr:RagB/SusD family nutrient uptake outer membrane protein [Dyadobacter jejuensis]PWJ57615.1 putative outer membrane starch-binding protein [Dyadobacter jejuensis]